MKRTRTIAIVLALLLLVILPVGCTSNTDVATEETSDSQEVAATEAPSTEETTEASTDLDDGSLVELVIVNTNGSDTLLDDTVGQQQVEEAWNVKLTAIRLTSDTADEKLAALFAAGEKMDIIKCGDMSSLVAQGVLGAIDEELLETYMPNVWARAQADVVDYGIENVADLLSVDGEIYAFPYLQESMVRNEWLRAFRTDILEEIGWDRCPETIEEYDEVFAAVKALYPDMYMIGGMGKDIYEFFAPDIMGAYTQSFNTWMWYEGEVVNSCVAEPAREYLEKMAEWFQLGYIDPEWLTDDWTTVFNKFAQGDLLTVIDHSGDINIYPEEYAEYQSENEIVKLQANIPGASMQWAVPVTGPSGRHGNTRSLQVTQGAMITAEFAENTVGLVRYMKMVDSMTYDLESILDWYGVEGENYELSGDETQPYLTWINGYDSNDLKYTVYPYPFYTHAFIAGEFPTDSDGANLAYNEVTTWTLTVWRAEQGYTLFDSAEYIHVSVPTIGSMPSEITSIGNENPDNILKEYYDAIIYGTMSVDAFDEMVEKWYSNGGTERTEWMNENAIVMN